MSLSVNGCTVTMAETCSQTCRWTKLSQKTCNTNLTPQKQHISCVSTMRIGCYMHRMVTARHSSLSNATRWRNSQTSDHCRLVRIWYEPSVRGRNKLFSFVTILFRNVNTSSLSNITNLYSDSLLGDLLLIFVNLRRATLELLKFSMSSFAVSLLIQAGFQASWLSLQAGAWLKSVLIHMQEAIRTDMNTLAKSPYILTKLWYYPHKRLLSSSQKRSSDSITSHKPICDLIWVIFRRQQTRWK